MTHSNSTKQFNNNIFCISNENPRGKARVSSDLDPDENPNELIDEDEDAKQNSSLSHNNPNPKLVSGGVEVGPQKYFRESILERFGLGVSPAFDTDASLNAEAAGRGNIPHQSFSSSISDSSGSSSNFSAHPPGVPFEASEVFKNKLNVKSGLFSYTWNNLTAMANEYIFSLKSLCREFQDNSVPSKKILDSLCGTAHCGEIVGILGGSSLARSMLLNVLAYRHSSRVQVSGDRCINTVPVDQKVLRKLSSFVQHQDIFIPVVTVREHLIFSAMLRMRSKFKFKERIKKVDHILKEVGLEQLKNVYIGPFDDSTPCLNRGQRKLLALASEFLTDSLLIFCETPTLNMDMESSVCITTALRRYAARGNIVIVQEESFNTPVLNQLDKIYLLAENQLVFQGSPKEGVEFFELAGYEICPFNHNPSDFFVRSVKVECGKEEQCSQRNSYFIRAFHNSPQFQEIQEQVAQSKWKSVSVIELENELFKKAPRYKTPWCSQLFWLCKREMSVLVREFYPCYGRILLSLVTALFYGLTFRLGRKDDMEFTVNFFVISVVQIFIFNTTSGILIMGKNLDILYRENYKNMYRPEVYYIAKNLCDIPVLIVTSWIFATVTYPIIGLADPISVKCQTGALTYMLLSLSVSALGYVLVIVFGNVLATLKFSHSDIVINILYSGILLDTSSVFKFVGFINNISIPFQIVESLMTAQWSDVNMNNSLTNIFKSNSSRRVALTRDNLSATYSYTRDSFWLDYYKLLGSVALGFRIVALGPLFLRAYLWGKFTPDK